MSVSTQDAKAGPVPQPWIEVSCQISNLAVRVHELRMWFRALVSGFWVFEVHRIKVACEISGQGRGRAFVIGIGSWGIMHHRLLPIIPTLMESVNCGAFGYTIYC